MRGREVIRTGSIPVLLLEVKGRKFLILRFLLEEFIDKAGRETTKEKVGIWPVWLVAII
jgi:hypothetical protein